MSLSRHAVLPVVLCLSVLLALVGLNTTGSNPNPSILRAGVVQAEAGEQTQQAEETVNTPECDGLAYPEEITQWCDLIFKAADQYGLDPSLVAALMLEESGGNALAFSTSGAVGLLQIMPRDGIAAGFQCANGPCFAARPTITELQDPAFNLDFGTRMLSGLIRRLGDVREALRAYGPMDVGYTYADTVLAIYDRYQ